MAYTHHSCICGCKEFHVKYDQFEVYMKCIKCGDIKVILRYDPSDDIPF